MQIEFSNRFFIMLSKLGVIFLIAKNLWKELIIAIFFSTLINILLDLFISSNNSYSLKKGIMWIAYNLLIMTGGMALFYLLFIYWKYEFKLSHLKPRIFFDWTNWKQYFYSGLESFVRNAFFIWFVIKTINRLESQYSQGDFWVMMTFIWGWLLLPILTLSQFINRDQALNNDKLSLKEQLIIPSIIVIVTVVLWLATMQTYKPFIQRFMRNNHAELISHLTMISLGFYIMFAVNEPIDKYCMGMAKPCMSLSSH